MNFATTHLALGLNAPKESCMVETSNLRAYLAAAVESEQAVLKEHEEIIHYLEELDSLFHKLVSGKAYGAHPVCNLLAMNAHASFLAAVSTALRGQAPPTFMILRGCLESALYAYLVEAEPSDGDVWVKRNENQAAVKANFNANRALQKLERRDRHLSSMAKESYQWTIEFGAHPNSRSVLSHVRLGGDEHDGYQVSLTYLHAENSAAVTGCLGACVENGCMVVAIICHAIPDHPEGDSTFKQIWRLFAAFQKHLRDTGHLDEKDYSPMSST